MKEQSVKLEKPSKKFHSQFLILADEYRKENPVRFGKVFGLIHDDFDGYLAYLDNMAKGKNLPPNYTQQITYWLILNEAFLIGTSFLRPSPPQKLLMEDGHIRYDIKLDHRNQGYGVRVLRLTLAKAKLAGLRQIILTCRADSDESIRTIMYNHGRYTGEFIHYKWLVQYNRYEIDL